MKENLEDNKPIPDDDGMLPEYDFGSSQVIQGRSYRRVRELRARRQLTPELAERFPDDKSVNAALEEYLRMKRESA